jgi:hypothetical protein
MNRHSDAAEGTPYGFAHASFSEVIFNGEETFGIARGFAKGGFI